MNEWLAIKKIKKKKFIEDWKLRQWSMILLGVGATFISSIIICHSYSVEPSVAAAMIVGSVIILQMAIVAFQIIYAIIKYIKRTITLIWRYPTMSLPIIAIILLTLVILGLMTRELLPF